MKRIVLAGISVYGLNNLSDDSMLSVFCRELHKNIPDLEITLLARHPNEDFDKLYGVSSIRNLDHENKEQSIGRWFRGLNPGDPTDHLEKIRKAIADCDLLIIGGEPFIDLSIGVYKGLTPYASLLMTLARFHEKPVMIHAIHMGRPLQTEQGKELARFCITNADLVTIREEVSRGILENMGIATDNIVTLADTAFGLDPIEDTQRGLDILKQEGIELGSKHTFAVTFRHMYWKWKSEDWNAYSGIVAELCDHIIEEFDADILFIPNCTYDTDHKYEDDRAAAKEIIARMKNKKNAHPIKNRYNIFDTLSLYRHIDFSFSNRRHPLIFAAIHGIAAMGCGEKWHVKPTMDDLSVGDYFIDIDKFGLEELKKNIAELWENREKVVETFKKDLPGLRQRALDHARLAAETIDKNEKSSNSRD